jgi:hypothetical protein
VKLLVLVDVVIADYFVQENLLEMSNVIELIVQVVSRIFAPC